MMDETGTDIRQAILKLERTLLDPRARASPERFSHLLAEDFQEFGSSGRVYDKAGVLQSLQGTPAGTYELDEFEVQMLGDEVALATYRTRLTLADGSEEIVARRSSIWVRRSGAWQLRFHQGTAAQV